MATNDFEDAVWIAETRRRFEALATELAMAARDLDTLQKRVMAATVPDVDPPVDPEYVPPTIAVAADRAAVKEG
jgi:hypothetical protein